MKARKDTFGIVGQDGRLEIPQHLREAYGFAPGARIALAQGESGLTLRSSPHHLTHVYVEPTTRCNLACSTCMRNSWEETTGDMDSDIFARLVRGLKSFGELRGITLGGFGEPLLHPDIADMVAQLKTRAAGVELITNATLLTGRMARRLAEAGLDVLWVSLDGASPAGFEAIRKGAELGSVLDNLSAAREVFGPSGVHLGLVFVAMKRTIAELPDVLRLGRRLGADRFLVTNVVPCTRDMSREILYDEVQRLRDGAAPSAVSPSLRVTPMDMCAASLAPLYQVMKMWQLAQQAAGPAEPQRNYCPFVGRGSLAVSSDGQVSPCLPLLHSHASYLNDIRRFSRRCTMGSLREKTLTQIWRSRAYRQLRERVVAFDFSPCTRCGGCHLSRSNEEDCLGNPFPACGACLWAQGIIRCP